MPWRFPALLYPTGLLAGFLLCSCSGKKEEPEWREYSNPHFSFRAPDDLGEVPVHGIDSFVGRFESPAFSISFDWGWYSNADFDGHLGKTGAGGFESEETVIDGLAARLGFYDDNLDPELPLVQAVFFPEVPDKEARLPGRTRLSFRVAFRDPALRETALRIVRSLRFAR
ncbi:MAG: hypothetical protein ACE5H3_05670 [Planctomycetota bacterium]